MTDREFDAASFDELDPAGMTAVTHEGTRLLLVRDGAAVHAVGATCPHAGGPLDQGIRCGDRIVCPWHKAAFSAATGRMLDPPAIDALPSYPVRIENGRVLVTPTPRETPAPPPAGDGRCFVIVGGGAAGAMAAQTLREAGFGGRVVMLDRENRVPYDRTLLSKYWLSGEQGGEKSPLQPQRYYRDHGIERITAEVTAIDAAGRRIACADGSEYRYDAALLATGGLPRRPDLPGADLRHVHVLRDRGDAEAILAQAERSASAVVLGASFIGMEVAASLRERGLAVTVVLRERVPFERQLGARIGAAFVRLHEKHGVVFRPASDVRAIEGDGAVAAVRLGDGGRIAADLVVIGFGVQPATDYASGLARAADGGLVVDARLLVAERLHAAGDIAHFPLRGDGAPVRVEHWRVAQQHGRVAALAMLGQDARYDAVPVFWTIHFMKRLDYAGHATAWDEVVTHGDLDRPEFLAYYLKDGKVAAAAGFDRDRDMAAIIELMRLRRDWSADALGAEPQRVLAAIAG